MPLTPNNREEHWLQGMVDGQTTLEPNKRREYWYKEIVDAIGSGGGGGGGAYAGYDAVLNLRYDDDTLVADVVKGDYASIIGRCVSDGSFVYAPLILVYAIDMNIMYHFVESVNLDEDNYLVILVVNDQAEALAQITWATNDNIEVVDLG